MSGIKHATLGAGAKVSPTMWAEDHVWAASGAGLFIWKDNSETALALNNQAATVGWTGLDLTALTSANAKAAFIQLFIGVDTATKDYYLAVRKTGTTPGEQPFLQVNRDSAFAGDQFWETAIVGLDTSQSCDYTFNVEAGGQCDIRIYVLGYWE